MPDIRRRLRSVDTPTREDLTLKTAAKWTSRGVFLVLLVVLVSLSVSADMVAIAVGASVLVAQMLFVVLPVEDIRARARRLWTGEAGTDAAESLEDRGGGLR